jgi:hypothetical protein
LSSEFVSARIIQIQGILGQQTENEVLYLTSGVIGNIIVLQLVCFDDKSEWKERKVADIFKF